MCLYGETATQAYLMTSRCARIVLSESYQSRLLVLFVKLDCNLINYTDLQCKKSNFFKKITDKHAPDYLIKKKPSFEYLNHYSTRKQLPYHLTNPKTDKHHVAIIFFIRLLKHGEISVNQCRF